MIDSIHNKLLILGGSRNAYQILRVAKKLGVKVGVVDYYRTSFCKEKADFSHCHDVYDIDYIVNLLKTENYDGIITGYSERLLIPYAEICNKSGLNCYGSVGLFKISTDKKAFKQLCKKHKVPVMKEYTLSEAINNETLYPIVVKPVDSAASVGVAICSNPTELKRNYQEALSVSKSKKVLIEKCSQGREATFFYFFDDGDVYFTTFAERLLLRVDPSKPPMPVGYIFPANIDKKIVTEFNNKVTELFKKEGFKNGMAFAQTFIEKDGIYLCEIGYRLTPSFETFIISALNNFNPIEGLVKFSLNNKINSDSLKHIDPFKGYAANITILLNPGTITKYEGIKEVKSLEYVLEVLEAWDLGHKISTEDVGTLAQVGLRVILTANSLSDLVKRMEMIKNMVRILDENEVDIAIKDFSYKTLIDNTAK